MIHEFMVYFPHLCTALHNLLILLIKILLYLMQWVFWLKYRWFVYQRKQY